MNRSAVLENKSREVERRLAGLSISTFRLLFRIWARKVLKNIRTVGTLLVLLSMAPVACGSSGGDGITASIAKATATSGPVPEPTATVVATLPTPVPKPSPTVAATPAPEVTFSNIALTDVQVQGGNVVIRGSTNLPDGSKLTVTFDVEGRLSSALYIGVDKPAQVIGGAFAVALTPPQRSEFSKGPYEVNVLFTPKAQTYDVLAKVGKDGERLAGPLRQSPLGFGLLELKQSFDLNLAIRPPTYPFDSPSKFNSDSPERAVAEFAAAWRDSDFKRMSSFTHGSWRSGEKDPAGVLEADYGFKHLRGFQVTNVDTRTTVADITFVIWYEAITNKVEKKITARVLRESGKWGVNPISTLKEVNAD